jgi:undecaprenyl-diphosphatase
MFQELDDRLFHVLNDGAANPFLDWLMPRLTNLHHLKWFAGIVILGGVLAVWKGSRQVRLGVLCAVISVGLSDVLASRVIKPLVPRERPCRVHISSENGDQSTFARMVPDESCPGSSSFPSNHASNMMALAGVGWWLTRNRSRWLWFLLPLIIGYSRIYLGYHYPSDTVGGWILGGLIAAVVIVVARRFVTQPKEIGPVADETIEEPIR